MPSIQTRVEGKRGCGYRKQGNMYLVAKFLGKPCGKLPIPLHICPTCNNGIKPARGFTWLNGTTLLEGTICDRMGVAKNSCATCPLDQEPGRVGLLWVGEQHYKTTSQFTAETLKMGVSRVINTLPRDFKIGETWVWLAHKKAIPCPDGTFSAGVFVVYQPKAVEYVVKDDDDTEKLERLEKRGITLVKVIKKDQFNFDNVEEQSVN